MGVAVALLVFDESFFFGEASLVRGLPGDAGSSFAGFRFFIEDEWRFPLLAVNTMTDASGEQAVIGLTDSIPLLALTAKVFGFLRLDSSTWIGLWYFGSYTAQGAAAALAVWSFGARSRTTWMSASLIAVSAPIFMLQTWHPGLLGHFTILLTWSVVGRVLTGHTRWMNPLSVGALLVSLLVHPYFFVMNLAILVGAVASMAFRKRIRWRDALTWFVVSVLSVVGAMFVLGYLPSRAVPAGGFGAYGIHLVGPFWPQWSTLWPGDEGLLVSNRGGMSGMSYMGAGALMAVVLSLVLQRRRLRQLALDHQPLLFVAACLTALAITPVVHVIREEAWLPLGDDEQNLRNPYFVAAAGLVALSLATIFIREVFVTNRWRSLRPTAICAAALVSATLIAAAFRPGLIVDTLEQFRTSGRFFWAVSYGATILALVGIEKSMAGVGEAKSSQYAGALIAALAAVQFVDVAQYRSFVPDMLASDQERVDTIDNLAAELDGLREVHLVPSWFCTTTPDGLIAFQDVVIAASLVQVPVDRFYGGRTDQDGACESGPPTLGRGEAVAIISPLADQPWPELDCDEHRPELLLCK